MKNKTWNRIKKMVWPYRKTVVMVTIIAILIDIIALAKPYLVRLVISECLDKNIYGKGIITISTISFVYISFVILENILDYFNRTQTMHSSADYFVEYDGTVYQYNMEIDSRYSWAVGDKLQNTNGGSLYEKVTNDNL